MGLVYQTNKQTGITYAYENEAYWDKGKQQSRARRKLIGKVDPKTGEIIPIRRYKKRSERMEATPAKPGPVPNPSLWGRPSLTKKQRSVPIDRGSRSDDVLPEAGEEKVGKRILGL
jgi:hypothetical protein